MVNDNVIKAKEKFGALLFYLVDEGFTSEHISFVLIHDPFFLCFEKNNINGFLETSMEEIIERCFHKKVLLDYVKPIAAEIFWAGEMYMSILYNLSIPIQRSVLVCPIQKMVSFFDVYHEMHESQLLKRYEEEEKKISVLKELYKHKSNMRKLSFLTGIKERTLISYLDNEKLFAASASNINALSSYFGVPFSIFVSKSSCLPVSEALLKDDRFRFHLANALSSFYGISLSKSDLYLYESHDDVSSPIVDLCSLLIRRKGKKPIVMLEQDFRILFSLALDNLKKELPQDSLIY